MNRDKGEAEEVKNMTITDVENMLHANDTVEQIDAEELDEASEEILDAPDEEEITQ